MKRRRSFTSNTDFGREHATKNSFRPVHCVLVMKKILHLVPWEAYSVITEYNLFQLENQYVCQLNITNIYLSTLLVYILFIFF